METLEVSEFTRQEHSRRAEHINQEAWKFEESERSVRGRLTLASLREKFGR